MFLPWEVGLQMSFVGQNHVVAQVEYIVFQSFAGACEGAENLCDPGKSMPKYALLQLAR